jgi:hypothetical protein
MELIQHQIRIRYASVTLNKSSLIAHSLKPPRLSGDHLNLKSKQKVNLREPPNIQVKLEELVKSNLKNHLNLQPQTVSKMKEPRKTLLQQRPVLSKLLKSLTDSEKQRLKPRKLLLRRQLVREELKLPLGNSNSIKRKLLLKKPARD